MSNDDYAKDKQRRTWIQMLPRPIATTGRVYNGAAGSAASSRLGSRSNQSSVVNLATPKEGEELDIAAPKPLEAPSKPPSAFSRPASLIRSLSFDSPPPSRPTTPKIRSSSSVLTSSSSQVLNNQASQIIINALERTSSQQTQKSLNEPHRLSFGKSLSSMLSLSRTGTRESGSDDRGRSMFSSGRISSGKSQSQAPPDKEASRSRSRARSSSPFTLRKWRTREASPPPQRVPLSQSDAELSEVETSIQTRSAFADVDDTDNTDTTDGESDDESFNSEEDFFDPVTERNTEQNAIIASVPHETHPEVEDPDPVGEGVNVVIAPEPYFPTSLNNLGSSGKRNPRRRKTMRLHEMLPLNTSRPSFQRDRCTITITQGDPDQKLAEINRARRRYVVASDMSEESRYAVEWGIGTVLRDGDEMLIVNVVENDAKVDPPQPNAADRSTKLRNQQERQGMAYILVRQVTGLLQRTRLNVSISCQAWHAKNVRHMLLDIIDYTEPTMLIVGSRGLSHLNGILLGSTSHYLIEKCSVPVMVARRRLKRPPKKAAHLSTSRTHIKLAEAGIDRVAGKVDEDVHAMRDELQKEEHRRDGGPGSRDDVHDYTAEDEVDVDDAVEGDNEDDDGPQVAIRGR